MKKIYQIPEIMVRHLVLSAIMAGSDPSTVIDTNNPGVDNPGQFEAKDQINTHDVWED